MSYQNYVIAAYAVFALVMLWDWLTPALQIRRLLRAARLQAARTASKGQDTGARLRGNDGNT